MFNQTILIDGNTYTVTDIDYRHEESVTDAKGIVAKSIVGTDFAVVQATSQSELDSLEELADGKTHVIEFPNGKQFNSIVKHLADSSFYVSEK